MSNKQTARLVLKTRTLTSNETNSFSTANEDLTEYTFNDINLRILLGDMYNKYELFNLSLLSIMSSIIPDIEATPIPDLNQLSFIINISGLPFINQTYNAMNTLNRLKCTTNSTTLTNIKLTRNKSECYYFYDNYLTFSKNQELCNLSFKYECISTGILPDVPDIFPDLVYIFQITGVGEPKDTTEIMSNRIF